MSKLIYVYGDDNQLLDTLVSSLRANGYSLEYTAVTEEMGISNITADIALICKQPTPSNKLTLGGLTLDLDNYAAADAAGTALHFTPTEFAMLAYLMKNASRAVSRAELLPAVWKFNDDSGTRVADDTVKRLRKKLANTDLRIDTVWGFGFKVREEKAE